VLCVVLRDEVPQVGPLGGRDQIYSIERMAGDTQPRAPQSRQGAAPYKYSAPRITNGWCDAASDWRERPRPGNSNGTAVGYPAGADAAFQEQPRAESPEH
jgi:hypothetical protein